MIPYPPSGQDPSGYPPEYAGVTEITAPNGDLFGEERLREAVRRRVDLPIEDILESVH